MLVKCGNCEKLVKTYPSYVKILKHIFCSKKCRTEYRFLNKKNSKFFEKINTEEKAYWLGFICADGWICNRDPSIGIGLSPVDKEHLLKFAKLFDVNIIESKIKVQVQVYNPFLYDQLLKKGVVPNKSLIDQLDVFEYIPKRLIHHFVRGWFDGDGSIRIKKDKTLSFFSINGTMGNLKKIREIIMEGVKSLNKIKIYHDHSIFCLIWGGNNQVMNIRKWLYKDATIFLNRKKEKFDSVEIKKRKGTSKYRGVSWSGSMNKWTAQIGHDKKSYNLGNYDFEIDAAEVYNKALIKFGKSMNYRNNI